MTLAWIVAASLAGGLLSVGLAAAIGSAFEWAYRILGKVDEPPITRWIAHELGTSHWFALHAAQRDLNWQPQIDVPTGLQFLADSLKSPSSHVHS